MIYTLFVYYLLKHVFIIRLNVCLLLLVLCVCDLSPYGSYEFFTLPCPTTQAGRVGLALFWLVAWGYIISYLIRPGLSLL